MTDLKTVQAVKNSRPVRLVDIIVMAVVTAAALALAFTGAFNGKKGAAAVITEKGIAHEYPLDENRTITLSSLTVVIENGEAYVINSDCPDKICERSGKISRVNQSIVCLPENVVITIVGAGEFQTETGQTN